MIALQIADIRVFMKKLLLSETFDRFLLLEGRRYLSKSILFCRGTGPDRRPLSFSLE